MASDLIPQCNPRASYLEHAEAIDAAVRRVMGNGQYILGPEVRAFEQEFAAAIGVPLAIGVANGTDALCLALRAVGVGAGDLVLTVAHTAVATAVAIRNAGANPIFVDVDPGTGLMSIERVAEIFDRTARGPSAIDRARIKAIVPVHLYGRCVDMDSLGQLASSHGVPIIEDCAQAHGATWNGRSAGSFGALASFSFYPTKNLGAIGDGGAVVGTDSPLVERVRLLREYGWRERYVSDLEGTNSRLDELQAAILRIKLASLASDNTRRRAIADLYRAGIDNAQLSIPEGPGSAGHVYHQFVIRSRHRDRLQAWLRERGVGTLVHYPRPIHLQPAYRRPDYLAGPLQETERWAEEVLSLPMFPQLQESQVRTIVATLNAWRAD